MSILSWLFEPGGCNHSLIPIRIHGPDSDPTHRYKSYCVKCKQTVVKHRSE